MPYPIIMKNVRIRITAIFIIGLLMSYILPIFGGLLTFDISLFLEDQDGLNEAWTRSIIFSLSSAVLNVLLAMALAIGLQGVAFFSTQGKLLSWLLIPVLLGNVSVAFVGKLLFATHPIFHESAFIKFVILLGIQFWQFGLLYTYLFWLVLQNIPQKTWEYAAVARLSYGEKFKDIILPAFRNLAMLLFILNFIFSFYEEAKIQFIFKASRGTHTEMISQWLQRHYQTLSLLNVQVSIKSTLQVSSLVLLIALACILITTFLFQIAFRQTIVRRYPMTIFFHKNIAKIYAVLLLLIVVFPLCLVFLQTFQGLITELTHLFLPLAFTALAALLATVVAIVLGILLRVGWQKMLASFNNRSLVFFVFLFFLQLLPPIALLITGFQWLRYIGYQNSFALYVVWLLGHIILVLPLLSSFLTVTHFRVSNKELMYLQVHQISLWEIVKVSFLQRFVADYLLTFLIAFSMIWNEAIINNLFSDFIPSFVNEMKMSVVGRGADYAKGMTYLLVSVIIAFMALWVWKSILDKAGSQNTPN